MTPPEVDPKLELFFGALQWVGSGVADALNPERVVKRDLARAADELTRRCQGRDLTAQRAIKVLGPLYEKWNLDHEVALLAMQGRRGECALVTVGDDRNKRSVAIDLQEICEIATRHRAAILIFAHNHPGSNANANPSPEDRRVFASTKRALDRIGVESENIIIACDGREIESWPPRERPSLVDQILHSPKQKRNRQPRKK